MDRLGSPPAAALLEAGRGGTAGGAETTSWASLPLSECHFKPHALSFPLDGELLFPSRHKAMPGQQSSVQRRECRLQGLNDNKPAQSYQGKC